MANARVDLAVLPEFCLTGFVRDPEEIAIFEGGEEVDRLIQLAGDLKTQLLAGFCIEEKDSYYNRALLIGAEGIIERYDKQKLFSYWNEQDRFTEGEEPKQFDVDGLGVAPLICYDLRFPEVFRSVVGAELFCVIANWPSERREHWIALLKARAIENQAYVVGVNRVGHWKKITFAGDSCAFAPDGSQLVHLGAQEGYFDVVIDRDAVKKLRASFPVLDDI